MSPKFDDGFEAWMELFAENINLNFQHAKEDRETIKTDLKEFIADEYKPLKRQVGKIETCVKGISGEMKVKAAAKQKQEKENAEVKVAKITSRWEFWGILVTQVVVLGVALIALLK